MYKCSQNGFHVQHFPHATHKHICAEIINVGGLSPSGWAIRGRQIDIETYLREQGFTLENDTNVLLGFACGEVGRLDIVKELIESTIVIC